jgi:hypothetical protein
MRAAEMHRQVVNLVRYRPDRRFDQELVCERFGDTERSLDRHTSDVPPVELRRLEPLTPTLPAPQSPVRDESLRFENPVKRGLQAPE